MADPSVQNNGDIVDPARAFAVLQDAIAWVPFNMVVFDETDRLIACSNQYRDTFAETGATIPDNLLERPIFFDDLVSSFVQSNFTAETSKQKAEIEKSRHRVPGGWQRDMKSNGEWIRRIKNVTPNNNVVSVSLSIDELIQKSTALAKMKRQLEYQAFHDPLTELPNRRALADHMRGVLASAQQNGTKTALLHIDLDKFKAVNDTMGHEAGDHVLRIAADKFRRSIRGSDFVARVGGDEFVVVQQETATNLEPAAVAQRIVNAMKEPISYNDETVRIGASVGISVRENIGTSAEEIDRFLSEADHALYEAKRKGRGCFDFFEPAFRDRHMALIRNISAVREAMLLRAFEPYFQPQVSTVDNSLIGIEALARWVDKERGVLHPDQFFSLLKEANLMADLDKMILEKSLDAARKWREAGVDVPRITINVSAEWLSKSDTVEQTKWLVDCAELGPEQIGFEVLEDAVNSGANGEAAHNLGLLKAAGFHIALDHFGTGDSSISSLRRVAFDRVKIDESFVTGIEENRDQRKICAALINLTRDLNLDPMCTGVEKFSQILAAQAFGCTKFQGFAIARPLSAERFRIWAEDRDAELARALSA